MFTESKPHALRHFGAEEFDDFSNAQRFLARHGEDLRYCYAERQWYVWSETHWKANDLGTLERWAKETLADLWGLVEAAGNSRAAWSLRSQVSKVQSVPRMNALIKAARPEEEIQVKPGAFDANPWLLNCQNGTLDLHTGKLMPHRREDLIDKVLPIAYDPAAECPRFLRFLDEITEGQPGMADYLQRLTGYCLTGDAREQSLVMFWGPGENGKTTLAEVLRDLIQPYARQANFDTFLQQRSDKVRRYRPAARGAAGHRLRGAGRSVAR